MTEKECQEGEIKSEGKCVLPVIFRKWQGRDWKEIVALFPTLPANQYGEITSYEHTGQHEGADYGYVVSTTEPAKPSEYRPLLKELPKIGYKRLKVYKKENREMAKARYRTTTRWSRMI
jgi:hypothetical protein